MIPPDRLDATIPCSDCRRPIHLRIPVAWHQTRTATVDIEIDGHALRLAVHAHFRQHA
jgi:hypothetical protein